ncbi:TVP38/TMEM64 family protein [Conexibacter sp. SYSU D00693]|uniref:TVP38/TMEM64 family protein n=1 Tax=Conexibacter sp. SYSU D00693 TaxID=2812560 RepID=UPI00196B227C|nr:VTT domain-containing protein [Conexibacter sp. SYSU D00693]
MAALLVPTLFPGPLLAGAGGLLFGTALGAPLAVLAVVLGAVLAFTIARRLAHDAVERLQGPRLRALREWVGQRGFLSVLYARLMPGVPYTLVNYAAGLSPVRLRSFTAATALGAAPRTAAYAALGGSFDDLTDPVALGAIGVILLMAVAGALVARREARSARGLPGSAGGRSTPAGPTAARP